MNAPSFFAQVVADVIAAVADEQQPPSGVVQPVPETAEVHTGPAYPLPLIIDVSDADIDQAADTPSRAAAVSGLQDNDISPQEAVAAGPQAPSPLISAAISSFASKYPRLSMALADHQ
jgi:hypothetical protein